MIFSYSSLLVRTVFSQHQRVSLFLAPNTKIESCDTLWQSPQCYAESTDRRKDRGYIYSSTMHVFVEIVSRDVGCEISAGKYCTRMSYKLTVVDRICQFFFFFFRLLTF